MNKKIIEKKYRPDPLQTIQKLIRERYFNAKAIFWAGSISKGSGNCASDLDLIIVYEQLANAYREAFIYDEWPIDAFIHDPETLDFFLEESRTISGIPGSISMILEGIEMIPSTIFSQKIKTMAKEIFEAGPIIWDKNQIDKERFLITDILDDIIYPISRDEQIASAAHLFEPLIQFYFRAQNKWCASGKSLMRYLKKYNPDIALEFTESFQNVFQNGNSDKLESFVKKKILEPYGGLLWNGFISNAPKEFKITQPIILPIVNNSDYDFNHQCYLTEGVNEKVENIILKNLKSYNESITGHYDRNHFSIHVKLNSLIIAGTIGDILGDLCIININWVDKNWVDKKFRNKKLGTKIFYEVEKYAKSKGYNMIKLNTTEFQAPVFYEKLGFNKVAIIPNCFIGSNVYVMKKSI